MSASNELTTQANRVITVNLPSKEKMDARAAGMLATVESLDIDSDSMLAIAGDELTTLKTHYKKLEEARKFHVGPLNEEVKYINNWFRDALACMDQAEGSLKRKMLTYQNEQERKRREEQARIEAAQRAERARIAAENAAREKAAREEAARRRAEQQAALERERAAQEEAAQRQREAEAAIRAGDEDRAKEAARLQIEAEAAAERQRQAAAQAEADAAATLQAAAQQNAANDTAAAVMVAPVVSITPKLSGIATKATYKGKVTDLLALVQYIATHPEYVGLVKGNETAINQLAKAQRDACKVEGILVYEDKTLAARSA